MEPATMHSHDAPCWQRGEARGKKGSVRFFTFITFHVTVHYAHEQSLRQHGATAYIRDAPEHAHSYLWL